MLLVAITVLLMLLISVMLSTYMGMWLKVLWQSTL
jgi:hypothetical protein